MSDIIRNYIETQGTPEEKEDYKQMNFARIWLMEWREHAQQFAAGCAV